MARKEFCPAGSTLGYATVGAPAVFTNIEGVTKIVIAGQKRESDDSTDMDSTSGYRQHLPTIKAGGTVTADINFAPGYPGQGGIGTIFEAGDTVNFKITLPGSRGTRSFAGFIADYGNLNLPVDKKATSTIVIQVTGPYTDVFGS